MASIAFSFSNSMASVPSGSDPEIRESAGSSAASRGFREAQRHLQSLNGVVGNSLLRVALPWEPKNPAGFDVSWAWVSVLP